MNKKRKKILLKKCTAPKSCFPSDTYWFVAWGFQIIHEEMRVIKQEESIRKFIYVHLFGSHLILYFNCSNIYAESLIH